jgi:tRNA 2-thiouridine synthesizing protein B
MTTLHTVNKSPFEKQSLAACLAHASAGSAVLLLEDGIYGSLQGTAMAATVAAALDSVKVYVLEPDVRARGFSADRLIAGVTAVDYAGFVDLAVQHDKVQAWL